MATKPKVMRFYIDDWVTSEAVNSFTLEQQGAYLTLLCQQFVAPDGMLPNDERALAELSRLGKRWRAVGRPIIARCFVKRGSGLINKRCRREWERAHDESRKRAKAARTAASARWQP
jgi:uncharacterized protein YdaU (DUF1376 family)